MPRLSATVRTGDVISYLDMCQTEGVVLLLRLDRVASLRPPRSRPTHNWAPVTLFPVFTGTTRTDPIFRGAADFDLELIENRTLDGRSQELIYRTSIPDWSDDARTTR